MQFWIQYNSILPRLRLESDDVDENEDEYDEEDYCDDVIIVEVDSREGSKREHLILFYYFGSNISAFVECVSFC